MKKTTLAFVAASLVASYAPAAVAENITLRIGAGHPNALTYVKGWDDFFETELKARAAELGYNVRLIEAWGTVANVTNVTETVSNGALDIGLAIPIFEASTLELYNFGNMLPFASPDAMVQARVIERMFEELPMLRTHLDDMGITVLGMSTGENYGMALRNVPERPEDIAGMRIASGTVNAPWTSAMGGVPVPIPVNENYQAMQSGLLDGNIFFAAGMEIFKFHEVLDAYYKTDFGSLPGVVFAMNNETRAELPADLVALIDELAFETGEEVARLSKERDEFFLDMIGEKVAVVQISDEDKARWARTLQPQVEAAVAEVAARGVPIQEVFNTYVRLKAEQGYAFPVDYSF